MKTKGPYSYVVLRYVHDVLTGEFVNVGVVMVAPREGKLLAKTRKTIGRLRPVFPDIDRHAFVEEMGAIDRGINRIRKQVASEGLFSGQKNASDYARMILPFDDSTLQWSATGSGLSGDAEKTFDRLYERFVSRYDSPSLNRRSDDDIWRPVKELLSERGVKLDLESKVVTGTTDSIEFSRAWKNGCWHAYEALSFDLADSDGIKDKARRWRGHLAAASDGATEDIRLHFIIGRPENNSLAEAYENAIEILRGAPFEPEVFDESQVEDFVNRIEDEVREHVAN